MSSLAVSIVSEAVGKRFDVALTVRVFETGFVVTGAVVEGVVVTGAVVTGAVVTGAVVTGTVAVGTVGEVGSMNMLQMNIRLL